jgi:hypothetical protein
MGRLAAAREVVASRLLRVRCSLVAAMNWRLLDEGRRVSAEATDDLVVVQGSAEGAGSRTGYVRTSGEAEYRGDEREEEERRP